MKDQFQGFVRPLHFSSFRQLSFVFIAASVVSLLGASNWAFAAEPLRSTAVKNLVCEEIRYQFEEQVTSHLYHGPLSKKDCVKGNFSVLKATYDEALKTTTLLEVAFETQFGNFSIAGTSKLGIQISVDRQGRTLKSWKILDSQVVVEDARSVADVLKDYFEFEKVNFHNGSFSLEPVSGRLSAASLLRDLTSRLEDGTEPDSCRFVNESAPLAALENLQEFAPELADFLEKQLKAGQIRFAVSRTRDGGESESCSYYYFEIVTADGYRLTLEFDFTT